MRIDLGKLESCGVVVDFVVEDKVINLSVNRHDEKAHRLAKQLARQLEFSDMETDELTCTIYRLQMFKALKFATGG